MEGSWRGRSSRGIDDPAGVQGWLWPGGVEGGGWGKLLLEPAVELIELVGKGEAVGCLRGLWFVVGDLLEAFPDRGGIPFRKLLLQSLRVTMFFLLHRFGELVLGLLEQKTIPPAPGHLLLLPQPLEFG